MNQFILTLVTIHSLEMENSIYLAPLEAISCKIGSCYFLFRFIESNIILKSINLLEEVEISPIWNMYIYTFGLKNTYC